MKREQHRGISFKKVIRSRRVAHTKAGGRVINHQVAVLVGSTAKEVGWAMSKSQNYRDAVEKSTKRAMRNLVRVAVDPRSKSFVHDMVFTFGRYGCVVKRKGEGMGITASPLITDFLGCAGVENGLIKIKGRPNTLLLMQQLFRHLTGKL